MAGRHSSVPKWPEVKGINDYAAFLGGLAMVITGLGFLVVTWTTVVLLGGFVSLLQKKDFWSLTVITFIQIAGVVDNFRGDKWGSVALSISGLDAVYLVSTWNQLTSTMPSRNILRLAMFVKQLLGWITLWVQLATCSLVYACGAIGIFIWGPYIATGVSVWRLKQHDYGNTDGDCSKANMKPALDVLYIIVVVQGSILAYGRIIQAHVTKRVVTEVASAYGFKGPRVQLVEDYMTETLRGCSENFSFVKGRNLVTYAVDLMGPDKPPQDYVAGINVLSTILGPLWFVESKKFREQQILIRRLILYAPSSHILRLLLVLSNPRSRPYGREMGEKTDKIELREVRKHAARIVAHMADGVGLEQLPQVIQCMSSLISTFEEHQRFFSSNCTGEYAKEEKDYLDQLGEGLHVLYVLAAADENNCRLIINTPGLLTKIMTPLASNLYHQTDHDTWENVLEESLKVMNRLTATYGHGEGETGAKLVREIEANLEVEAVETMMSILRCDKCSQKMGTLAMGILTNLHAQMQTAGKQYLIEMLVHIYNTVANSRTSALEALATLCFQDGSNAAIILQVNDSTVSSFTEDLKALSAGYHSVAEILQHACHHYTREDKFLRILKESMTDMMPKVLSKILTVEATQAGQQGDASQPNGQSRCSSLQEHDVHKTETALLSLCVTIHETFISADQYLAVQFDEAIGEFSVPVKLREMVERNSEPKASCLKILKLTSRMVISMMKCRGSRYQKPDLESLVEALLKACSRNMYFIDRSMDFARGDNAVKPRKPGRILASFVTEAMELVRDYGEPEAMSPSTIVGGELSSN